MGWEDLGGREPPLSERGLSPSKPPSLTENFPHDPAASEAKICFVFLEAAGSWGKFFVFGEVGIFCRVRLRTRFVDGMREAL